MKHNSILPVCLRFVSFWGQPGGGIWTAWSYGIHFPKEVVGKANNWSTDNHISKHTDTRDLTLANFVSASDSLLNDTTEILS